MGDVDNIYFVQYPLYVNPKSITPVECDLKARPFSWGVGVGESETLTDYCDSSDSLPSCHMTGNTPRVTGAKEDLYVDTVNSVSILSRWQPLVFGKHYHGSTLTWSVLCKVVSLSVHGLVVRIMPSLFTGDTLYLWGLFPNDWLWIFQTMFFYWQVKILLYQT